jgi:hypothetical protein
MPVKPTESDAVHNRGTAGAWGWIGRASRREFLASAHRMGSKNCMTDQGLFSYYQAMEADVLDQVDTADPVRLGLDRPPPEKSRDVSFAAGALREESDSWLSRPESAINADSLSSARGLLLVFALCVSTCGLIGLGVWLLF